jgi:hypothetical protein
MTTLAAKLHGLYSYETFKDEVDYGAVLNASEGDMLIITTQKGDKYYNNPKLDIPTLATEIDRIAKLKEHDHLRNTPIAALMNITIYWDDDTGRIINWTNHATYYEHKKAEPLPKESYLGIPYYGLF